MSVMRKPIGVGIIGASPGRGWGSIAHVPAVQALPDFALRAISTSRPESARTAAEALGVTGYHDYADLIGDPRVDLVVVTVRVPSHFPIIRAAIAAGKAVLSEWPLATGLDEAIELERLAGMAGVHTAVGLQARFAPGVAHARRLIDGGYVGDVVATTMIGSALAWGAPEIEASDTYIHDAAKGVTTLSVTTMHALEALAWVLGEPTSVVAELAFSRRHVRVAGEDRVFRVTAPDQVALIARLPEAAPASVFIRGGSARGPRFRWEINGTDGDLVVTAGEAHPQAVPLTLSGGRGNDPALTPIAVPAESSDAVLRLGDGPAANVARLYEQLARDLRDGTQTVPGFAHAVHRHRTAEAVQVASAAGERVELGTPGLDRLTPEDGR